MPRATSLGERIRTRRLGHQLTLGQVAKKVGVSVSALSQLERDQFNPTIATLKAIATTLGTTIGSLVAETSPLDRAVVRASERKRLPPPRHHVPAPHARSLRTHRAHPERVRCRRGHGRGSLRLPCRAVRARSAGRGQRPSGRRGAPPERGRQHPLRLLHPSSDRQCGPRPASMPVGDQPPTF